MTRSFSNFSRASAFAVALAAMLFGASCGKSMMQQGDGSSYIIVDSLQAASGAKPTLLSTMLAADVNTVVAGADTVFSDPGQATMHVAMKDPTGVAPTGSNTITITGYHVDYVRNDGGTAVPASFDGSITVTVGTSATSVPFTLVNAQAKTVTPLAELVRPFGSGNILVSARVTFFGHDQAGHAVTVATSIGINFADWADPTT